MKKKLMHKRWRLLLVLPWLLTGTMFAQNLITGTVKDVNDETLPGATVVIKGTTTGTITDMDGKYQIEATPDQTLVFSFVGMQTREFLVGNRTQIDVVMESATETLDEIVVTGYGGTQQRSKLTNSIASVKEETLKTGVHANPAQALSGAVSGLKVTQSSGKPGATPSIILRGGTNLDGSGSPLILVDGQVRGSLSDINPEDIESMEVLKDAGATALYGARANNGVVLISTRSGKAGRSELTVKTKAGLNYLTVPYDFMNARDYLHWARTGVYSSGHTYQKEDGSWSGHGAGGLQNSLGQAQPYGTGNLYWDPQNPNVPLDGNQTTQAIWSPMLLTEDVRFLLNEGWQSMIDPVTGKEIIFSEFIRKSTAFNNPALTQDYNISLSGGNDRGSYYAGLGYYDEEGLPVKTWYKRLTFTFNGDYKIKEWLTSTSNLQFADAKWYDVSTTSEQNYFGRMISAPPTIREYNAAGELLMGNNVGDGNPLYNVDKLKRNNNTDKFTMGQSLKFDLLSNLSLTLNGRWMYDEEFYESFNRDYLSRPGVMNTARNSSAEFQRTLRQTYNSVLNYDLSFAKHTADVLLGYEFYDSYTKGFNASGSGAPTDDFGDLGLTSNEEGKRSIDSWHYRERIKSYFGRLNYDYNDKYLVSVTFRRDGYSRLLGDNRWGLFPGISTGWIAGRESFIRDNFSFISFLKLRASYGLNGNVSGIGPYELQGSYGTTKYNNQVGYVIGAIPNPTLKWERSQTFEVGMDVSFLENKINSNFTFYNRLTVDKYANIPLPQSSGISSIRSNNGEFRNRGIEMDFSFKVLRKGDLTWDINANLSHNINTIVSLPDNGLERNRQSAFQVYDPGSGELIWVGGYQEGQRPGDLYVFESLGIFKDEAQIAELAANRTDITSGNNGSNGRPLYGPDAWAAASEADKARGLPITPGDVIWRDVNGDNVIDNFDVVKVGNVNPKWFGGITSNTSYKGLSLSLRMDYALGFKQLDGVRPWFMGMMQGTYNSLESTKNTWTPENTNAQYPIYQWADQLGKRNYARPSDIFVYDGSYLAFREVSLAYQLPTKWFNILGVSSTEVSVTGQNLGYLTASELYSPEVASTGGTWSGYSLPRTIIFGLNVKF